jgi:hypothetical protein
VSYAVRPLAIPAAPQGPGLASLVRPLLWIAALLAVAGVAAWCLVSALRFGAFVDSRLAAGILYCAEPPDSRPFTSTCSDHSCLEREARILTERQAAAVKYQLRCTDT